MTQTRSLPWAGAPLVRAAALGLMTVLLSLGFTLTPNPTTPKAHAATAISAYKASYAMRIALTRDPYPYVYGASGPTRFDCSGLTQWSYARAGVYVPRTTNGQRSKAIRVSKANLRPGDLIFWHSSTATWRNDNTYHVAIYVGNGRYFHAANPTKDIQYGSFAYDPLSRMSYGRVAA